MTAPSHDSVVASGISRVADPVGAALVGPMFTVTSTAAVPPRPSATVTVKLSVVSDGVALTIEGLVASPGCRWYVNSPVGAADASPPLSSGPTVGQRIVVDVISTTSPVTKPVSGFGKFTVAVPVGAVLVGSNGVTMTSTVPVRMWPLLLPMTGRQQVDRACGP